MNLVWVRLSVLLAVICVATTAGMLALPEWDAPILAAGICLAVAVILSHVLAVLGMLGPRGASSFESLLVTTPVEPARPADLVALERTIGWGSYSGAEFDHRVRPLLLRLFKRQLWDRHRVDIEADEGIRRGFLKGPLTRLASPSRPDDTIVTGEIEAMVRGIEGL